MYCWRLARVVPPSAVFTSLMLMVCAVPLPTVTLSVPVNCSLELTTGESRALEVVVLVDEAHAEGLAGTAAAIEHGMDTIEHGMYLNQRPELLEAMAAGGQVLVPTLSGYYWMAGLGPAIDPDGAELEPEMLPSIVALAHHNLEQGARSLRAARAAGVKIALGSDRDGLTGEATALELLRMVHHGLSVSEALVAATQTAAQALGLEDRIGTVQPGRLADLVVLDGDVLTEPELLLAPERIWLVLQLGEPVAGAALESPAELWRFATTPRSGNAKVAADGPSVPSSPSEGAALEG